MRTILLGFAALAVVLACMVLGCSAGGETNDDGGTCPVGSEKCPCTQGGTCDTGLECLSNICVDPGGSGGNGNGGSGTGGTGTAGNGTGNQGNTNCDAGCKDIDVVFALDSSGSMIQENSALAATSAFAKVVSALAAVNCSQIDFRIGVTNDYTPSFVGQGVSGPWFDSTEMDDAQITAAFNAAATQIASSSTTPAGCEHVLTNTSNLLLNDQTGFLRTSALLVLVLVTDVDDYGEYDKPAGNSCGMGCTEASAAVADIHTALVTLKSDDPKGVAAIVVAGDPTVNGGVNMCNQPGTCGCNGVDCDVFHAYRLWELAGLLGSNGLTANLCAGPDSVPGAVQAAFEGGIDLACKGFDPPK